MYALDTNIVIKLIRGNEEVNKHREEAILQGISLVIPIVVDYEIMRGFHYKNAAEKERLYCALKARHGLGDITSTTWEIAAQIHSNLRKKGYTVGDNDILIAAFCIENDYTLVTKNIKDFENVPGLKLTDWS